MDLKDSVILITGSAERVGRAIALLLARKGARVVIQYRTKEAKARETAAEIAATGAAEPLVLRGDISRIEDWRDMKAQVLEAYGRIDVLVNNAAIFYKTPFFEISEAQWEHFMNVNLKGVFLGCQVFGEVMMARQHGKIINIADVAAAQVWPGFIPYCVSKAGVVALTEGLARALGPYVTVNAVAPGTVLPEDEGHDSAAEQKLIERTPLKRIGTPEDVARTVAFLIEGSDFITGVTIKVDGGRSLA